MIRTVFAGLVLVLPVAAQQPSEEEKEFLRQRHVKRLLDPKSSGRDFNNALAALEADNPKGHQAILKAVGQYGRDRAKDKDCYGRWRECLDRVTRKDAAPLFPAELVPDLLEMLDRGGNKARIITFLGDLGPKAKAAVPALEKHRDGDNDALALEARRALKKIQAK